MSEYDSVETSVLKMVKNDPFASIGEIKNELLLLYPDEKVSWWRIFSLLKKNKLLRRKSRFRYVRKFY